MKAIEVPSDGYGTVTEAQMEAVIAFAEFWYSFCKETPLRRTPLLARAERARDGAVMRLWAWRYKMARDIARAQRP